MDEVRVVYCRSTLSHSSRARLTLRSGLAMGRRLIVQNYQADDRLNSSSVLGSL